MNVHYLHPPSEPGLLSQFTNDLSSRIQLTTGEDNPTRFFCDVLIEGRPPEELLSGNKKFKSGGYSVCRFAASYPGTMPTVSEPVCL